MTVGTLHHILYCVVLLIRGNVIGGKVEEEVATTLHLLPKYHINYMEATNERSSALTFCCGECR
jgi:hypothetical protein